MKFKVSDRVRIASFPDTGHRIGDVGTVAHVSTNARHYPYTVTTAGGLDGFYDSDEIELVNVPALLPVVPEGVTPNDLADYVTRFVNAARDRVLGVGAEQYATGERQLFEEMTPTQLITMAREEAQDLAVYAAMLDIRLARIGEALNNKGVGNAA